MQTITSERNEEIRRLASDMRMSLAEIGRQYGVSRERIRQIVGHINAGRGRKEITVNGNKVSVPRVVVGLLMGKALSSTEVVHHLDGNCLNNDVSNLRVFPNNAEHTKWHHKHGMLKGKEYRKSLSSFVIHGFCDWCGEGIHYERSVPKMFCSRECQEAFTHTTISCYKCGKLIRVLRSYIETQQRRGYQHIYCSHKCLGKDLGHNHGWGTRPHDSVRYAEQSNSRARSLDDAIDYVRFVTGFTLAETAQYLEYGKRGGLYSRIQRRERRRLKRKLDVKQPLTPTNEGEK
jgi:hypothetical protein